MFGCGEYEDITMLKYLDETLDKETVGKVNEHLKNCGSCLQELKELTRINAVMEAGIAEKIPLHARISIFINQSGIGEFSGSFQPELVKQTAVRSSGEAATDILRMELPDPPIALSIMPVKSDIWIGLDWIELSGKMIELMERDSKAPVYMKRADQDSLTIKGIVPGHYTLHIEDTVIDIQIKGEK